MVLILLLFFAYNIGVAVGEYKFLHLSMSLYIHLLNLFVNV